MRDGYSDRLIRLTWPISECFNKLLRATAWMQAQAARPFRHIRIACACIAVVLGAFAWMQINVNRAIRARNAAYVTAANRQWELDRASAAVVNHYREIHDFKSTLQQFCNDMNGGRPLGKDEIFQDPLTGGRALIITSGDGPFMAMAARDLPPEKRVPFEDGIHNVRIILEDLFGVGLMVLCPVNLLVLMNTQRRYRILLGQWMVLISFSLMLVGFLGSPVDEYARWGVGFLAFSILYLAVAFVFDRAIDPTPRCRKCRYNLTGNQSGVCPECGTLIPS